MSATLTAVPPVAVPDGQRSASGLPILCVKHLHKRYGPAVAIADISFDVGAGEIVTLLGPSGCGKSTTLRAIAGLEMPDEGEIELAAKVVTSASRRIFVAPEKRNVGVVFQSYAIWPHMTVGENVGYPLRLRHLPSAARDRKVAEMLALVGLKDYERRPATQLSGGQQQRVALARALCYEPDILLLDEPLSNLDAKLRPELLDQIRRLQRQRGTSVLFVTHDQIDAMTASHRIVVMKDGRIEQIGTPEELYEQPTTAFVHHFVGRTLSFAGVLAADGVVVEGQLRPLAAGMRTPDLLPGAQVTVTTRPENVTLSSTPAGAWSLPGIVEETTYLGERVECEIAVGAIKVRLGVDTRLRPDIGEQVWLTVNAARLKMWQ